MIMCSRCGALIPAGEKYCKNCVAGKKPGLLSRLLDWISSFTKTLGSSVTVKKSFRVNIVTRKDKDAKTGDLIRQSEQIEMVNENTGETKHLGSMDQLPPHLRELVEKMRAKAEKEGVSVVHESMASVRVVDPATGRSIFDASVGHQDPDVWKHLDDLLNQGGHHYIFRDSAGNEFAYESLDQMPAEIRAVFERAKGK